MTSQTSPSHDRFATTRWSLALRFAEQKSPTARDALAELGGRFRYPIYVYARRRGRSPAAAAALARDLLRRSEGEPDVVADCDYRRFLLERLAALNEEWDAGDSVPAPREADVDADLEARFQEDQASFTGTPEQAFQRSFALVILQRSLRRLRNEAESTGHLDMFRALESFLVREPPAAEFERIARNLRIRHVGITLALKRLRQRLRELAAEELADTVRSADDLAREQQAMLAALAEHGR